MVTRSERRSDFEALTPAWGMVTSIYIGTHLSVFMKVSRSEAVVIVAPAAAIVASVAARKRDEGDLASSLSLSIIG